MTFLRWVRSLGAAAIATTLGFVRENARESSTRLVMIMFGVTACLVGLGAEVYAFIRLVQVHELELLRAFAIAAGKPGDPMPLELGVPMVAALGGVATIFVGSGAIAIALRTRKSGEPGDGPDPKPATP
jgi:hypothetical protein